MSFKGRLGVRANFYGNAQFCGGINPPSPAFGSFLPKQNQGWPLARSMPSLLQLSRSVRVTTVALLARDRIAE
jgi:hypothetical protein